MRVQQLKIRNATHDALAQRLWHALTCTSRLACRNCALQGATDLHKTLRVAKRQLYP